MSTRKLDRIAVFCGSNTGKGLSFIAAARELGVEFARRNVSLVFGGTHKGLMGSLADALLENGGTAHGIITERLADLGHLHPGLTSHEVVPDMKTRKARMAEMADAFIALPGGIGTTEEFVEAWTLNQLGYFDKPVGLLNVSDYFEPFLGFIDNMVKCQFLPPTHRHSISVEPTASDLLDRLSTAAPISTPKWL